jgi:hypothetical protein
LDESFEFLSPQLEAEKIKVFCFDNLSCKMIGVIITRPSAPGPTQPGRTLIRGARIALVL